MSQPHTRMLRDGFSTVITLANVPTIKLYEKEVTPPAWQGGGPIDQTTMRNSAYRTAWPKSLKMISPLSAVVAYATEAMSDIIGQLNVNQLITVTFPDQSTVTFWGYLDEFTPNAHTEGEQPTANITVQPTNKDEDGDETAPNYLVPSGEST